jgi:replication-associated recombination protein RarA
MRPVISHHPKENTMTFDKKHRPRTLSDVIFASTDVQQTLEDYANNKRDKHLLLYGPKGTGKSVSAELIMRERLGSIWQAGLAEPFNAKSMELAAVGRSSCWLLYCRRD